jgi:hypothetical protein
MASETLINHFQGGQSTADNSILTVEIIWLRFAIRYILTFNLEVTIVHSMDQGIDFIL